MRLSCHFFIFFLSVSGYNLSSLQNYRSTTESSHDSYKSQRLELEDSEEPGAWNAGLKSAWQDFTRSGRYRLVRLSDLHFSEQAKYRAYELNLRWWKSQHSTSKGLAVIIVDTKRTDAARFGVIIFRPVRRRGVISGDAYTAHWLYRNRDLSSAALQQISDTLTLFEINDDGSYKRCNIEWNQQQGTYICRQN